MSSAIEVLKGMWIEEKDKKNFLMINYKEKGDEINKHFERQESLGEALLALQSQAQLKEELGLLQKRNAFLQEQKEKLKKWLEKRMMCSKRTSKEVPEYITEYEVLEEVLGVLE